MKLVHAADLHLDSALRGLSRYESAPADEIRGATRRALGNLVELCLEERAGLLLISGDLFDGDWRDVSTGLFFAHEMTKLVEAGVQVAWIRGNHDAASQMRKSIRLPEGVFEFSAEQAETRELERLGVAVHGRSFARRDVTDDLAASYPARRPGLLNVGLLHTALEGRAGHDRYAPCRVETLLAHGYEYWALGHVHEREVVHQQPWIVFPGNLQGRHARELGEKGATLVTYEGDKISSVAHRSLDVVRWAELQLSAERAGNLDDLLNDAQLALRRAAEAAQGRLLAFRVRVSGTSRLDAQLRASKERLSEELCSLSYAVAGAGAWFEKLLLETRPLQAEAAAGDEALAEIGRVLGELSAEEGGETLTEVLADLARRLPAELLELVPELRAGEGSLALLADVQGLLSARLSTDQETP